MADREVSWSDYEDEVVVPVVSAPAATIQQPIQPVQQTFTSEPMQQNHKEKSPKKESKPAKKERDVPEWEIDTKGDYEGGRPSYNNNNNNNNFNNNVPEWPAEDSQLPPLTRRPGRDPLPGHGNGSRRDSKPSGPSSSSNNGEKRASKERKWLEEINLPGVDLSKMPAATTKLTFDDLRSARDDDEGRRGGSKPSKRRESAPREEASVPSWGANEWTESAEPVQQVQPVQEAVYAAPVTNNYSAPAQQMDDRELAWGDEPAEPVSVQVTQQKTEPVVVPEQPQQKSPKKSPKKKTEEKPISVAAVAERLDSLGWGDEEEVESKPVVESKKVEVKPVVEQKKVELKPAPEFKPSVQPAVQSMPQMQSQMPIQPMQMPMPHMAHQMQMPVQMAQPMQMPMQISQPGSPVMCMPQTAFTTVLVGCPFCYQSFYYPIMMPIPAGQMPPMQAGHLSTESINH